MPWGGKRFWYPLKPHLSPSKTHLSPSKPRLIRQNGSDYPERFWSPGTVLITQNGSDHVGTVLITQNGSLCTCELRISHLEGLGLAASLLETWRLPERALIFKTPAFIAKLNFKAFLHFFIIKANFQKCQKFSFFCVFIAFGNSKGGGKQSPKQFSIALKIFI